MVIWNTDALPWLQRRHFFSCAQAAINQIYIPRDDGRVRKEEDPDAVPTLAVDLDHLVLVADPVPVPAPDGRRVVHAEDIDILNLEASCLHLVDDPAEGTRGVRTGEDVLVHEEAPNEILILPRGTDTGDLENEDAVVVEEVIHLTQERAVAANADVLSHLEGHDLGVRRATAWDVAVVEAEDARARRVAAVGRDAVVTELGLVLAEGDAGDVAAVVLVRKGRESAPTTTNIKQTVGRLEIQLMIVGQKREKGMVSERSHVEGRCATGKWAGCDRLG